MALDSFNFTITKINVVPDFAAEDPMFPPGSSNIVSTVDLVATGTKKYIKDNILYQNINEFANTQNETLESHLEKYPDLINMIYGQVDNTISFENIHIPFQGGNTATLIPYNNLNQDTVIEWASNTLIMLNGENAIEDIKFDLEVKCDEQIQKLQIESLTKSLTPDLPWQS